MRTLLLSYFFLVILISFNWRAFMEFDWQQVFFLISRTLHRILANLIKAVFLMVSILLPFTNSYSSFSRPLRTVPSASIIIYITVTFMFQDYFCSLARSKYLSLNSLSLVFTIQSVGTVQSSWHPVLFSFISFFSFFMQSSQGYIFRLGFSDLFVSRNLKKKLSLKSSWTGSG